MFIRELIERISFWRRADRIGPDILLTHWKLYFPSLARSLCLKKFKCFDVDAELRPGSHIISCSKISIGKRVIIRPGSVLMADPREGEHGITIEDDVMLGHGVHMYVNSHAFHDPSKPIIDQETYQSRPIVIKRGAWIGANAVILSGVEIGENSVIGAGSVISKNVPARSLVAPATVRLVERPL